MNSITRSEILPRRRLLALALMIAALSPAATIRAHADAAPALLDDFAHETVTTTGANRPIIDDQSLGGQSQATATCAAGVYSVRGDLVPARGAPAFISVPLLLSPDAKPRDLSAYEGVRLRVKVTKGILSVQVASAEIDNFDFHTSAPITRSPDAFTEVRIAFKDLKRAWSEQTALNLESITSVNLVAAGMARDSFAYEVDEIGFY